MSGNFEVTWVKGNPTRHTRTFADLYRVQQWIEANVGDAATGGVWLMVTAFVVTQERTPADMDELLEHAAGYTLATLLDGEPIGSGEG